MTSECSSNLDVVQLVGCRNFGMSRVRGGISHQLKVVFHALVLLSPFYTASYELSPVPQRPSMTKQLSWLDAFDCRHLSPASTPLNILTSSVRIPKRRHKLYIPSESYVSGTGIKLGRCGSQVKAQPWLYLARKIVRQKETIFPRSWRLYLIDVVACLVDLVQFGVGGNTFPSTSNI